MAGPTQGARLLSVNLLPARQPGWLLPHPSARSVFHPSIKQLLGPRGASGLELGARRLNRTAPGGASQTQGQMEDCKMVTQR